MFKVKFADIGEGLTEGKVTEVLVKVGDSVKMGDSLFHVETDKVNSEIPAPVDGKVAEILVKADEEIKVGQVVFIIDDGSKSTEDVVSKEKPVEVVKEENASVVGSTPVSNDVIVRNIPSVNEEKSSGVIKASPLARKVAAELGIDLSKVTASGPNGRILVADIKGGSTTASTTEKTNTVSPSPVFTDGHNFEEPFTFESKPMNGIRKATMKAMTYSSNFNAAFTGMRNMDITETFDFRGQLKDVAASRGIKLTYLAFIVKATATALKEMPNMNVRIDLENNAIQYVKNINIGVAVDTPDGLMVPVIKGVDKMSVFQIANKITELADKARNKKLSMKEMSEGTVTISNFGSVALDYATPIINSPESLIIGVGNMTKTPTYIGENVVPRYIMPFSATADHRIIDGADVGRLLDKISKQLSNPIMLLV
ncbi:dihydrolipoamide acetyltransferase family protein [Mesoplasma photuris]|uniref:dihydrolipoamide acetyltransferase family protein n=1 Tax=Mesoplasma photuris TaxID=217731 RepID=UPI0004E1642D|nr:dihydrolipoamide acetyltransferase family protein [Mesoplasma photuris]